MTLKVHTHYDNLKVARNAPLEVIRAAYRVLSQKYHPDKNPGSAEAVRLMAIFNAAYAELSDPVKRAAHDVWIAAQEAVHARPSDDAAATRDRPSADRPQATSSGSNAAPMSSKVSRAGNPERNHGWKYLAGIATVVLGLFVAATLSSPSTTPRPGVQPVPLDPFDGPPPVIKEQAVTPGNATRRPQGQSKPTRTIFDDLPDARPAVGVTNRSRAPMTDEELIADLAQLKASKDAATRDRAPNGRPWPSQADYVQGYKRLNTKGLSRVTIDNSQMNSPAYVKLVDLKSGGRVRHVFIPAHGKFTIASVSAGEYDVRYKDLDGGQISRTESFALRQFKDDRGTTYSDVTLTLYKVRDGNMKTDSINESDF